MNALEKKTLTSKENKHFNILIVDDCQVSFLYLSKLLFQLGFTSVDHVTSYQQAIKLCSKQHYSLLFIDYHLEQILNGSELYNLLKEKGFIQPYTRVITISGDNTIQTVLSTLSKGNGDYLCKPISKSVLSNKMSHAFQEFQIFKILHHLKINKETSRIKEKAISLAKHKNIDELDQIVFDLFIPNNKEELLHLCQQPEFSTRRNYILTKLKLDHELNLSSPENTIVETEHFCQKYPLFAAGFDFLVEIQGKQYRYEDALLSANKALDLTPSVPSRALIVLRLALGCNDKMHFLKASHLLANHLPVADQNWCAYVAECFSYYDDYIQHCQSESDKKQLILEQKNFVRRSEYRLTKIQKKQLSIIFSFSECRRLIENGDIIKAKRQALKIIQPFFDNLHQLNSVVLVDLLYLLTFFGEIWLLEKMNSVIKTKHYFNQYCLDSLQMLKNDNHLKASMAQLSQILIQANQLQHSDPKKALSLYQEVQHNYPYSSELCIGLLECYLALSLDNPSKVSMMVALIQDMPLSINLIQRRDILLHSLHSHLGFIEEKSTDVIQPHKILNKDPAMITPQLSK